MELPKLEFTSSSAARGGTNATPWYQGDFVTSFAGDARSGDRTAPPPLSVGSADGAIGTGVPTMAAAKSNPSLLIAGAILIGALLWKVSR
jgi:hypothetical protein